MYLLQAPLGRFILGYVDPHVRVAATPSAPTLARLIAMGAASLARAVVTRDGVDLATLPVVSGTVTVDSLNEPRRVLQAQIAGLREWIPVDDRHPLHPMSRTELRVEIGVANPRGEDVWVSVGVFSVTSVDVQDGPDGVSIGVHCPDRIPRIRRTVMRRGVTPAAAAPLENVISQVFAESCGDWIPLRLFETGVTVSPGTYGHPGADPWQTASDLVSAHGYRLILNGAGEAELKRVEDITKMAPEAVWRVGDKSSLANITHSVDVSEYATGVIIPWTETIYTWSSYVDEYGETQYTSTLTSVTPKFYFYPDAAQREYIILDNDASSVTSDGQAWHAGKAKLVELGKGAEKITGSAIANPYLEPDAVVQIDDEKMGLEMITRITKLTFTLKSNVMAFELGDRELKVVA